MIPLHRIASLVYNRPLLITPEAAEVISGVVRDHITARLERRSVKEREDEAESETRVRASAVRVGEYVADEEDATRQAPYRVTPDGSALIEVVGELVNRGAWIGASSGLVSYEGLSHQLKKAARDSRVKTIVLDIDSPGGEAVGCFETAETVRKVAAVKPVVALFNGRACSAAYAIASGASKRVTTLSSVSGSIGVVMLHMDVSKAMKDAGVKPTFIFAGDHKVDGNPYQPLPEEVRERFEEQVNAFYEMFVDCVAAGTGLEAKAIRATQARTFDGPEAVRLGLADEIGSLESVINGLSAGTWSATKTEESMKKKTAAKADAKPAPVAVTEAEETKIVASSEAAAAEDPAEEKEEEEAAAGDETPEEEAASESDDEESEEEDEKEEEEGGNPFARSSAPAAVDPSKLKGKALLAHLLAENAKLKGDNAKLAGDSITAKVDRWIDAQKTALKINEAEASEFRELLVEAYTEGNTARAGRIERAIEARSAAAPATRLPKAAVPTAGMDVHDVVMQRLRDAGCTAKAGTPAFRAAYAKALAAVNGKK